ncbi:MAG: UvrD-helicase domain-containing protein [Chloroflexota bacterium]|nr:UvrD-helicase domain-containing protein [Dehalococcoidia bacterium]MDW8253165.1 UvrD-helicase domain-containing protein [Chloroflexota bacterium]
MSDACPRAEERPLPLTSGEDPILRGLNDDQRDATTTIRGPLLILAGPGSGKTRVISHRVAYLIRTIGVSPRRIMAVTFTNKAARELIDRIERLVGNRADQLAAGTFHALCAQILRAEGKAIGIDPHFHIFDDDDQLRVMKWVLAELRLDERQINPKAVLNAISRLKAELLPPDQETARYARTYFEEIVHRAYALYQERLRESRGLDFDDLIAETVRLFCLVPAVAERYQERYLHVMVDEFQDTNIAQYELVKILAAKHRNLAVVGDPDQSIYRFRSADIRNILNFERDFPDAKVVVLTKNYRSTQYILDAAAGIIAANTQRKPKELVADRGRGRKIVVRELANEEEEATEVAREIERLMREEQRSYRDFAVMYRTNGQSRPLEERFNAYAIPYRLVGGTRFYERKEVKDVLAYLRILQNPLDAVSLTRILNVPPRGIGQKTVDDLVRLSRAASQPLWTTLTAVQRGDHDLGGRARGAIAAFVALIEELRSESEERPLPELIEEVVRRTGYYEFLAPATAEGSDRLENIRQLAAASSEFASFPPRQALTAFLEKVALLTAVDQTDSSADAVTLITLHAAKGLEFPVVFIIGLEEGLLPHSRAIQAEQESLEEIEEERRLLYVGVTRAQERLYLFRAYRRNLWGRNDPQPPSRFLDDIPPETREPETIVIRHAAFSLPLVRAGSLTQGRGKAASSPPFKPGDRVRQALLGEGTVIQLAPLRDDLEVTVAFRNPKVGIRKLLQSIAKLEKIPGR